MHKNTKENILWKKIIYLFNFFFFFTYLSKAVYDNDNSSFFLVK